MTRVTLRLYDTLSRSVRDFVPVHEGCVGMYLCGDTVYGEPHIGHAKSKVVFDVLARWLTQHGYAVTYVRNITDVDDKIIRTAAAEGVPWWQVAQRNIYAIRQAYDLVGCAPPTMEPLATAHITQMHALIQRLIDAGRAYAADGNVYFDVASLSEYAELSHQKVAAMQQGETGGTGKRNLVDFTLWKTAKEGEPAWPSPWGAGRPGWHLECSAMAEAYLGGTFDIHGGGLDLIFPHHENERAQSLGAGDAFANFWLHNGLLTMSGEKMSKSLGNTLLVRELAERVRPAALRCWWRPKRRTAVSKASSRAPPSSSARTLASLRCARTLSRPWTTTSARRARWLPCTMSYAAATRHCPQGISLQWLGHWVRRARC